MPTIVGNYELLRKIGEGGYGKIFLANRVIGFVPGDEVVLKQVKLPTNKQEREMCLRCVRRLVSSPAACRLPSRRSVAPTLTSLSTHTPHLDKVEKNRRPP
jgi:serine/threonine protein kinase